MTTETPTEAVPRADEALRELELRQKNMRWGWALFGLFVLLFGGTVAVAYIYLWLS
jgi:hypothetical protein